MLERAVLACGKFRRRQSFRSRSQWKHAVPHVEIAAKTNTRTLDRTVVVGRVKDDRRS